MPRYWRDYALTDWARLRPLTHRVKTTRYRVVDALYRRRSAAFGNTRELISRIHKRRLVVTIAFADPLALGWQIALVRHYVPNVLHVVVDNSASDSEAEMVRLVAVGQGIPYLRCPRNPWVGNASRSHGIALNWVWHNLVRPGRPEAFGFIDDDLFPTAVDDPFAPLAEQSVYGLIRTVRARWFLWAGFCFFRYDAVHDKRLDFGQDWFIGLDTGGGNWTPIYSQLNRDQLHEPTTEFFPFKSEVELDDGPLQWCGTWLHEIGNMGRPELVVEKRRTLAEMLSPHLGAAGYSRTS